MRVQRVLPNFVVIGTTKGGTTSLYEYLRTHPDIFLPATKELRFFTVEDNWHRGIEWYRSNFDSAEGESAVGEVSPCYTLYPALSGVPERMARLIPKARLVYVVRHPIERMCSHYLEHAAHGWQRRPISEALWDDPRYIYGSCYTLQIERFLEYFHREQLLVVTTEALRTRQEETLARVFRFLGVDQEWRHESMQREFYHTIDKRIPRPLLRRLSSLRLYERIRPIVPDRGRALANRILWRKTRGTDAQLPPEVQARLRERLAEDVARLYPFVEGPFDGWGIA
jgi:Sulfotransferase domain